MTTVPKSAKKPADRKAPAKRAPKPKQVEDPDATEVDDAEQTPAGLTVVVHGRDWLIEYDTLNDFELIEDFAELGSPREAMRFPGMLRRVLGDRQFHEAMDLLRDPKTGRVPVDAGVDFFLEVFKAMNPNSSSSRSS